MELFQQSKIICFKHDNAAAADRTNNLFLKLIWVDQTFVGNALSDLYFTKRDQMLSPLCISRVVSNRLFHLSRGAILR